MNPLGQLSALRDAAGVAYERLPCMAHPHWWDSDATVAEKDHAAALCRTACPAIVACWARAQELGPGARGVWAGTYTPRGRPPAADEDDDLEDVPAWIDPTLARWEIASGVASIDHSSPPPDGQDTPHGQ